MRPRKWILILFTCICLIIILLYQGIRLIERNRNIESILIQRISEHVDGSFSVEKVRLGFFAVYLQNVNISIPLQAFKLRVNDIKVGFSLRKLIAAKGDFARSIDKIIIVNPEFQINIQGEARSDTEKQDAAVLDQDFLRNLPVSDILVKNGSLQIFGLKNKEAFRGGGLNGKMLQDLTGTTIELEGRLASLRKNLTIAAHISPPGGRHRLSVRLKNARLRNPLNLGLFEVTSGDLDGVCEFSFPDTNILGNLQSGGRIEVSKAEFKLNEVSQSFTGGFIRMKLEDSRLVVDSLKSKWGDISLSAGGNWDIADMTPSYLNLYVSDIDVSSLPQDFPAEIRDKISGTGWLSAQISKIPQKEGVRIETSFGGFSIGIVPIINWKATWVYNQSVLTLNSLKALHKHYRVNANGKLDFQSQKPAYSFSMVLNPKSQLFSPDWGGEFQLNGKVSGIGKKFSFDLSTAGKDITYRGTKLDSVFLVASGNERKVVFSNLAHNGAPFLIKGSIDSPFSAAAKVRGSFDVDSSTVGKFFQKISANNFCPESPLIKGKIGGTLKAPEITAKASFTGKIGGDLNFHARPISKAGAYRLTTANSFLVLNKIPLPVFFQATVSSDSFSVDSLNLADRIKGRAFVKTDESEEIVASVTGKSVALSLLDSVMMDGKKILRDGYFDIHLRLSGKYDSIRSRARINLRDANIGGVYPIQTDMVVAGEGKNWSVHPFVVRKDKRIVVEVDSLTKGRGFFVRGQVINLDLENFAGQSAGSDLKTGGRLKASFTSTGSGFPIMVTAHVPKLQINEYSLGDVDSRIELNLKEIRVLDITAADSTRLSLKAKGVVPWTYITGEETENDTVEAHLSGRGDLLAVFSRYLDSPIGGSGEGTFDLEAAVSGGKWRFRRGDIDLTGGTLTLYPFVMEDIKDFSFHSSLDRHSRLKLRMKGKIRKRRIEVVSSHDMPEGIEGIRLGPVSAGALMVDTPDKGIHIHLPGFMAEGETADIEFSGREPFEQFAISGPIDKLRLTGTWTVRDVEFTFPLLEEEVLPWSFDPFPYITWDMDIKVGNRNVIYFYDVGMKKRLMRVVEAFVDPNGEINIRGRDKDKTFRLHGGLRSYRGAVYYGRRFDRNVQVGVDFVPELFPGKNDIENLPFIWGSAEAFSDTSRFDRIKLTLLTKNPETGGLSEKGRFNDITFRLSSEFDEIPGESQREFYRKAGLRFITLEGAGGIFSDFGEKYLHRYFLQRFERKIARRLGLDVMSFETSIASNYFYYLYNNNFQGLAGQWDNLALANVGLTLGRYFWRDRFFLKWRTELVPSDTLIYPEHRLGLEYYPMRYLFFDVSYGFHRGENHFKHNPGLNMQLRLPIAGFRKVFDF